MSLLSFSKARVCDYGFDIHDILRVLFFFFQAEDGIRDGHVTGVQTCALPISLRLLQSGAGRLRSREKIPMYCSKSSLKPMLPCSRNNSLRVMRAWSVRSFEGKSLGTETNEYIEGSV